MAKELVLAVAGSRKTQGIIEACAKAPDDARILILTYTQANQNELRARLSSAAGTHAHVEVMGWFSFLITHIVRPYLPFLYINKRVLGFDFESEPQQYAAATAYSRYFNSHHQARKVHLAQLAHRVLEASNGAPLRRLARLYGQIYIDEVQDLCGWDLEILEKLFQTDIPIQMVGDVRQAILVTNQRERKNSQHMYMKVLNWFKAQQQRGRITITERVETFRCHPDIATFADSLFPASWSFAPTVSRNERETAHDGVFLVRRSDVDAYIEAHSPLILRKTANSARNEPYDFMNIGKSKGLSHPRVLIWPTAAIETFLRKGAALNDSQASYLYVAVTRAEQSVAFVVDSDFDPVGFVMWDPNHAA